MRFRFLLCLDVWGAGKDEWWLPATKLDPFIQDIDLGRQIYVPQRVLKSDYIFQNDIFQYCIFNKIDFHSASAACSVFRVLLMVRP